MPVQQTITSDQIDVGIQTDQIPVILAGNLLSTVIIPSNITVDNATNAVNAVNAVNATNASNATNLNNQAASYYLNASFMNAGVLPSARLNGSYNINVSTANTWATSRNLQLTGAVTGNVSINGSSNVSLATTLSAHAHATTDITSFRNEVQNEMALAISSGVHSGINITYTPGGVTGVFDFEVLGAASSNTLIRLANKLSSGYIHTGQLAFGASGNLGMSMDLSADGNILIVGRPFSSSADGESYIYRKNSNDGWAFVENFDGIPGVVNTFGGFNVVTNSDGSIVAAMDILNASTGIRVWVRSNSSPLTINTWTSETFIDVSTASDQVTNNELLASNASGTRIAFGVPNKNTTYNTPSANTTWLDIGWVYILDNVSGWTTTSITLPQSLLQSTPTVYRPGFGKKVVLDGIGNVMVAISSFGILTYEFSTGWTFVDNFSPGYIVLSIKINYAGNYLFVGGNERVYIYERVPNAGWTLVHSVFEDTMYNSVSTGFADNIDINDAGDLLIVNALNSFKDSPDSSNNSEGCYIYVKGEVITDWIAVSTISPRFTDTASSQIAISNSGNEVILASEKYNANEGIVQFYSSANKDFVTSYNSLKYIRVADYYDASIDGVARRLGNVADPIENQDAVTLISLRTNPDLISRILVFPGGSHWDASAHPLLVDSTNIDTSLSAINRSYLRSSSVVIYGTNVPANIDSEPQLGPESVEIYPPAGYTMQDLRSISVSLGAVFPGGTVDSNDTLQTFWRILDLSNITLLGPQNVTLMSNNVLGLPSTAAKIWVTVNNSEQRQGSEVNFVIEWSNDNRSFQDL